MSFWITIVIAFIGGLVFAEMRLYLMKAKVRNITYEIGKNLLENEAYLTYPGPRDRNKVEKANTENIVLKDIHVALSDAIGQESMHKEWKPRRL